MVGVSATALYNLHSDCSRLGAAFVAVQASWAQHSTPESRILGGQTVTLCKPTTIMQLVASAAELPTGSKASLCKRVPNEQKGSGTFGSVADRYA